MPRREIIDALPKVDDINFFHGLWRRKRQRVITTPSTSSEMCCMKMNTTSNKHYWMFFHRFWLRYAQRDCESGPITIIVIANHNNENTLNYTSTYIYSHRCGIFAYSTGKNKSSRMQRQQWFCVSVISMSVK